MAGTGLTISTYNNGVWTTRVSVTSNADLGNYLVDNGDYDWLVFDLGGVEAEQIKFTIPSHTESGWVTFYEMECYGALVE